MTRFSRHIKKNFPIYLLVFFFSFLFLFKLDYNTITSWDEGWYADIAREIVRGNDWIFLRWNGSPYFDHPAMGFWLMAITYKLFGISELTTRLPSALLGVLTIFLVYKIGLKLFKNQWIGLASALILGTSVWYVIRVRSGNLESVFMFFYALTVYLTLKAKEDFRWFILVGYGFGGLVMSKTLVGWSAAVLIFFYLLPDLFQLKKNWQHLLGGTILFLVVVLPWYLSNYLSYPDFINQHFFNIGLRNKSGLAAFLKIMPQQPLFYLHMGVRKWYYFWLVAVGYLILSLKLFRKPYWFLFLWNAIVFYPFLTSEKTELWHLIPVYLPLSFLIAGGFYDLTDCLVKLAFHLKKKLLGSRLLTQKNIPKVVNILFSMLIILVAAWQVKVFWKEVLPEYRWLPDDVDIAKKVAKYDKKVYIDDDFMPLAVYYSGKNMVQKKTAEVLQSDEKNYVIITRQWATWDLDKNKISYRILERNKSFLILTKK